MEQYIEIHVNFTILVNKHTNSNMHIDMVKMKSTSYSSYVQIAIWVLIDTYSHRS